MSFKLQPLILDEPEDWTRCFGLLDNPFSPLQDRPPLFFRNLGLETAPLRPHLDGLEWLHPEYYAHDIEHIDNSMGEFVRFVQTASRTIRREGLITLVHGGEGSGKTSFTNLCRSWLRTSLPGARCVDFDAGTMKPDDGVAVVTAHLAQKLTENGIPDAANPAAANPAAANPAAANPANQTTFVVLLVENLSPTLLRGAKYETNQAFQFLNWIATLIRPSGVPLIFATTWEKDVSTGFAARAGGGTIDRRKIEVREFLPNDVLNYIGGRVALFRDKALFPDDQAQAQARHDIDLTYFPFEKAGVQSSFTDRSERELGLPVRSVNRILSGALQQKMLQVRQRIVDIGPFDPALSADELRARMITADDLATVVQDWKP